MKIIRPEIFRNCKNIIAATSTKIENSNKSEFGFNLSFKVGDDENLVNSNRKNLQMQSELISSRLQISIKSIPIK